MAPRTEPNTKNRAREKKSKPLKKHHIFAVHKVSTKKTISNAKLQAKIKWLSKKDKERQAATRLLNKELASLRQTVVDRGDFHEAGKGQHAVDALVIRGKMHTVEQDMAWVRSMVERIVVYLAEVDELTRRVVTRRARTEVMMAEGGAHTARGAQRWRVVGMEGVAGTLFLAGLGVGIRMLGRALR